MTSIPPVLSGSKIETKIADNGSPMLVLPIAEGNFAERWGAAGFLMFWLCGWAFGEVFAAKALLSNKPGVPSLFLTGWLGAWTIGGFFAMRQCYMLVRGPRPDILVFNFDSLEIRRAPRTASFKRSRIQPKELWARGRKSGDIILPKSEVQEPRLEWVDSRQRLTMDCGVERVEIGDLLTEPEREWLFKIIAQWKNS